VSRGEERGPPGIETPGAGSNSFHDDTRARSLERRLQAIESKAGEATPDREDLSRRDLPEEQKRRKQEQEAEYSAKLERHRNDHEDPAWAPRASANFADDLGRLSEEVGFGVKEVSCKIRTCTAHLSWANFSAAMTTYSSLLHYPYTAECAREIILPDPMSADDPYEATAFFDCPRGEPTNQ
jgi:hypothetical protein